MLSRPSDSGHTPFGDIFLSESPDMIYWGRHRHVMSRGSEWWQSLKVGGGAAPIETDEGWLLFYHGVSGTCNGYVYSIGGAILDIDQPSIVKYRCENFLLTPEAPYEERGFVANVCFPCATLQDTETGRIAIYYGAADSVVGLAFYRGKRGRLLHQGPQQTHGYRHGNRHPLRFDPKISEEKETCCIPIITWKRRRWTS